MFNFIVLTLGVENYGRYWKEIAQASTKESKYIYVDTISRTNYFNDKLFFLATFVSMESYFHILVTMVAYYFFIFY
jgi:hypothetical protein